MREKILGCLLGAAVGDAMGAATEGKSPLQIEAAYGGKVTGLVTPDRTSQAWGRRAGQITDAFSIPYLLTEHLLRRDKMPLKDVGEAALLDWGRTEYFDTFAGMTTRNVVNNLRKDDTMSLWSYSGKLGSKLYKGHYYALSTNGAAVKAYPAGLMSKGDVDRAIRDTVELTMASHDDPYSISGACAVAAAVSQAMHNHTTVREIMEAALEGSIRGEELARKRPDVWTYPGPSVTKRIRMAEKIAVCSKDPETAIRDIGACIGNGPAIAETVPAALGILMIREGHVMDSIIDGANLGDETSAIASIAGSVSGAYRGASAIEDGLLECVEKENKIDLRRQAKEIEQQWYTIS